VNQRTGAVDIRRGILAAFVAAVALLLFSVPRGAGADSGATESLRSRAAQVMADIDRLDARRDAAIAAQQRAQVRLTAARETLAQTEIRISAAEGTVHAAEQRLADTLVAAYKRSDGGNTTGYLLGAASFSDLINRVDVIDRISNSEADVIAQVQAARKRLDDDRRQQQQAVDAANRAVADAAAARASAERLIAERKQTLAAVSSSIRTSIGHEEHRRTHLAKTTHSVDSSGTAEGGAVFYGDATWYGWVLAGHTTASGEIFDPMKLTCANPWLPFGTLVRVTLGGRSVVVKVNDRGPFGGGVIDLSLRAAQIVGLYTIGRARVKVEVVGQAPITP
jgi:rare lipoprotein A